MYKIFLFMMFLVNILFMNFNNPLILGLLMLIQSLNLITIMGKIYYTFWFSYIFFLVFIGGLFILFVYVISLTYNNKFFNLNYYKFYLMIIFFFFIIFYLFNMKFNFILNSEILSKPEILKENLINSLKFYNLPNCYINLLMITFLLMLMIIVVKITNFYMGPIKNKF